METSPSETVDFANMAMGIFAKMESSPRQAEHIPEGRRIPLLIASMGGSAGDAGCGCSNMESYPHFVVDFHVEN